MSSSARSLIFSTTGNGAKQVFSQTSGASCWGVPSEAYPASRCLKVSGTALTAAWRAEDRSAECRIDA